MTTLMIIILSLLGVIILFSVMMLFRNEWVYSARVRLLLENYEAYHKLPSYDKCLNKFWVWDIKKFIK